jgi:hypothetical protein
MDYKNSVIKIENWWIKYKFCIGNCQKFVQNTTFIGQLPTTEMSCYNYIYMCKHCIENLKNKSIENEIEGYCIGKCEQFVENCTIIGIYNKINIYMCKNCIINELINSESSYSQNSEDNCYKCNDYGICFDCQPFNPVFDTWGLPRGYTRM